MRATAASAMFAIAAQSGIAYGGDYCEPYCDQLAVASVDHAVLRDCPSQFKVNPDRRSEYEKLADVIRHDRGIPDSLRSEIPQKLSSAKCDEVASKYGQVMPKGYLELTDDAKRRLRSAQ